MRNKSSVMATNKPDAVLFIVTEILAAKRLAFSAGLALAIAPNAPIKPITVPSNPVNIAMFAREDK